MILLALKADGKIINRCDAWEMGGEERMVAYAKANGYKVVSTQITPMGDMVIWIA